ncbi:amylo-alpha-1,6-glucosidase [Synergistales bacterium]|nr:amylo-alpha-1,6-glucosidase [Synergistales bacterium]
MYLGKADVNTYDKGVEREFLISNGTGDYGSSTVAGSNTRKEHGLLVSRERGTAQHIVLIGKVEETLHTRDKKYQLSTNRYKDIIYPDGYRYVQEYQGRPFPSVLFVIHSVFLKKSIFMPQSGSGTIIKYELLASPESVCLDVRPLAAHRDNKSVPADKAKFESSSPQDGVVSVKGRGIISHVSISKKDGSARWTDKPLWFDNIVYEKNGSSDAPLTDSLWSPGFGSVTMEEGDVVYVLLSAEPTTYTVEEMEAFEKEAADKLADFVKHVSIDTNHHLIRDMLQASGHLVESQRGDAPTIFSGFPSAARRARETFISLPGLTLATERTEAARGILDDWLAAAAKSNGLMPYAQDSEGKPIFGDIDAGLWFLYAVDKYSAKCGIDYAVNRYKDMKALLDLYFAGPKELGAVCDEGSKLLKYFNKTETCHWMSGDVAGEPLVYRSGYLAEVNSLWYNALCFMREAAAAAGDSEASSSYENTARECRESFERVFWNGGKKYLFDWVDPEDGTKDDSIRPNAILSISLPHPVLSDEKGRVVLATCWNELYTTYGLRTLDPHHEKFKGRAEGRPDQREKARLRGMAWPWLLCQFITAYMRYNPDSREIGWSFVRPFSSHLRRGCLGGVAEYFDGMMPYLPNGDVLSAVSLGELLRVMCDDMNVSKQS